jgi:hydrogenase/urease accessory protein HupE
MIGFGLLLTCLLAAGPAPHPNSMSRSRIDVDGADVRLTQQVQVMSVLELIEADADGDGELDAEELAAIRDELGAYLAEHYTLRVAGGGDPEGGRVLEGRLLSLKLDDAPVNTPLEYRWLEAEWELQDSVPIHDLMVEMSLFFDVSPDHRDIATLVWHGEVLPETVLWAGESTRRYADEEGLSAGSSSFGAFVRLGIEHILIGIDHIAFLLALIVAAPRLKSVVGVVTAFTVAHSITLALAAMQIVTVPARVVEPIIALSIVVVGVENLVRRKPHGNVVIAFAFGLVHGLGFASVLADLMSAGTSRVLALVGFNLGVEIGQLGVVLAAVGAFALVRASGRAGDDGLGLAPPGVRFGLSLLVSLAGAVWFFQRVFGL